MTHDIAALKERVVEAHERVFDATREYLHTSEGIGRMAAAVADALELRRKLQAAEELARKPCLRRADRLLLDTLVALGRSPQDEVPNAVSGEVARRAIEARDAEWIAVIWALPNADGSSFMRHLADIEALLPEPPA